MSDNTAPALAQRLDLRPFTNPKTGAWGCDPCDQIQSRPTAYPDGTWARTTEADAAAERKVAAILYRHGLAVVKAGGLAEIDLLAVAGERLVGAVEVKRRYHEAARYPTLYINLRKVAAMATWCVALGVPAWFVVVYDDQVQAISLADLPGAVGGCRVDGYRVRHGATALEPVLEVRVNAMRLIGRTEETAEVEIGGPASIPDQSRMVDLDGQPLLRDQATLDQAVAIAGRLAPLLGGDRVGHFRPISPLDCWAARGDRPLALVLTTCLPLPPEWHRVVTLPLRLVLALQATAQLAGLRAVVAVQADTDLCWLERTSRSHRTG